MYILLNWWLKRSTSNEHYSHCLTQILFKSFYIIYRIEVCITSPFDQIYATWKRGLYYVNIFNLWGKYRGQYTSQNTILNKKLLFKSSAKRITVKHLVIVFRILCPDHADGVVKAGLMVVALLERLIAKCAPSGRFCLVFRLEDRPRRKNETLQTGRELHELQVVVEWADLNDVSYLTQ